jgi:transcriptional regulator with XRE-family HTH domain
MPQPGGNPYLLAVQTMTKGGAGKGRTRKRKRPNGTLGHLLQSLRQEKDITGDELAKRLGTTQATVSKVETGRQKPTMEYIVRFAAEIELSKAETTDLLTRLNLMPAGPARGTQAELLSLDLVSGDDAKRQQKAVERFEARAAVIRAFNPQRIPEILQTEEYARSDIRLSGVSDTKLGESLVRERLKRQKEARKKELLVTLTEGALRARVCSFQEMARQLKRIKSFAEAKNSRLAIIGWQARLNVTVPPAFEIYDNALACVELPHGQLCLTREKDIEVYIRRFEALEKMAVVGTEGQAVLERIVQDFERLSDLERSANVPSV